MKNTKSANEILAKRGNDIELLKRLYYGHFLSNDEAKRAGELLHQLKTELKQRV